MRTLPFSERAPYTSLDFSLPCAWIGERAPDLHIWLVSLTPYPSQSIQDCLCQTYIGGWRWWGSNPRPPICPTLDDQSSVQVISLRRVSVLYQLSYTASVFRDLPDLSRRSVRVVGVAEIKSQTPRCSVCDQMLRFCLSNCLQFYHWFFCLSRGFPLLSSFSNLSVTSAQSPLELGRTVQVSCL